MIPEHVHGKLEELTPEEVFDGVERRSFSSEHTTFSSYRFQPGGTFPIHRHPAEQVTIVLEGSVRFTVAGEEHQLGPGEWSVIAGEVEHGITAGAEGARLIAMVSPRRERSDEYEVVGS